jgi:hypothetical protein
MNSWIMQVLEVVDQGLRTEKTDNLTRKEEGRKGRKGKNKNGGERRRAGRKGGKVGGLKEELEWE